MCVPSNGMWPSRVVSVPQAMTMLWALTVRDVLPSL